MLHWLCFFCKKAEPRECTVQGTGFGSRKDCLHKMAQMPSPKLETIANKGDLIKYEIRYRKISELFIGQYSVIFIHNTHISKPFRYVNSCISMQFHGRLVRNWCGGFGICHTRKQVHHDITFQNTQPCNNVFCTLLQGCFYFAFS